jgi:hypothetical protein
MRDELPHSTNALGLRSDGTQNRKMENRDEMMKSGLDTHHPM